MDGPPAMIMPAHPQVGNVYRVENIPGLVFEEVHIRDDSSFVMGVSGIRLPTRCARRSAKDAALV